VAKVIYGAPTNDGGSCTRPQGHRTDPDGTWTSTQCKDERGAETRRS
jgi:hypothetical protein